MFTYNKTEHILYNASVCNGYRGFHLDYKTIYVRL